MVTAPAEIPVTEPVPETVARAVLLLFQAPPDGVDDNDIELPTHTADGPEMAVGNALTVNGMLTEQPVGKV